MITDLYTYDESCGHYDRRTWQFVPADAPDDHNYNFLAVVPVNPACNATRRMPIEPEFAGTITLRYGMTDTDARYGDVRGIDIAASDSNYIAMMLDVLQHLYPRAEIGTAYQHSDGIREQIVIAPPTEDDEYEYDQLSAHATELIVTEIWQTACWVVYK